MTPPTGHFDRSEAAAPVEVTTQGDAECSMTKHDNSLHGSFYPATDAPMRNSARDDTIPTDPDISLHRAGLLPAEARGDDILQPAGRSDLEEMYAAEDEQAYRNAFARS